MTSNISRLVTILLVFFLATMFGEVRAHDRPDCEHKAAFMCNIARFVELPSDTASKSTPLVIGVIGEHPFDSLLEKMAEKVKVKGRPLNIRFIESPDDFHDCHVLFVGKSGEYSTEQILSKTRGLGILTVSDTSGFASEGGMIEFRMVNNEFLLQVNNERAQAEGLKISSRLLKIANLVNHPMAGEVD